MTPIRTPGHHASSTHDEARNGLLRWFLDAALPIWFERGIDWAQGGFHEQLTDEGTPQEAPRRTRVVARQIYVFCVADKLGWRSADAQRAVRHGLAFLLGRLRQADGLFASSVDTTGKVIDARFDLYEQAFALFAMAHAHEVCADMRPTLRQHADALMDALQARYKHPALGFEESRPPSVPLRANPHMHMLEAMLAWETQAPPGSRWHGLADELAQLALRHLIDQDSGVLYELFNHDWQPWAPDKTARIVEPGHLFEWGWLLTRWGHARQHADALAAGRQLIALAQRHGICPVRQVAVDQLNGHLAITGAQARLWPQTERVKACHALNQQAQVHEAIEALNAYLRHPCPGLWHEAMQADGRFPPAPCKASSFYHIVCIIDTLMSATLSTPYEPD